MSRDGPPALLRVYALKCFHLVGWRPKARDLRRLLSRAALFSFVEWTRIPLGSDEHQVWEH